MCDTRTKPFGKITIEAKDDTVCLAIIDDGIGFDIKIRRGRPA